MNFEFSFNLAIIIDKLYTFSEQNPNNISKEDYQKLYKTAKNNVKLKDCENFSLKQEVSYLNKHISIENIVTFIK